MSNSEASPSPAVAPPAEAPPAGDSSPSLAMHEDLLPVGENITELNKSQSELLGRLRGLKEDLQSWRNNLDTQVMKYKTEISDIKTALNSEIDQLKSDFQELRTTLKKQQEDVSVSLKNLGLEDAAENDGNKGNEEENVSEAALAGLGNLKLEDNPENPDESSSDEDEKNAAWIRRVEEELQMATMRTLVLCPSFLLRYALVDCLASSPSPPSQRTPVSSANPYVTACCLPFKHLKYIFSWYLLCLSIARP